MRRDLWHYCTFPSQLEKIEANSPVSYGEVLMHEREKTVLQVQHQAFDDSTPANQHSLDLSGGIKSERQPLWNEHK